MKKKLISCLLALTVIAVILSLPVFAQVTEAAGTASEAVGTEAVVTAAPETEVSSEGSAKDFVFWDILRVPISYIIRFCYKLVPNYAIALLLFAIIIKIILFPLSVKQQKNSVKQASLRPKEAAIRKRYAGRTDQVTQQKVQQEIMDLYQKEGFNQFAGCLPLLIQLPILLSLYQVVMNPLKYLCGLSATAINSITNKINQLAAAHTGNNIIEGRILSESIMKKIEAGSQLTGIEQINAIRWLGEENFSAWLNGISLPKFNIGPIDLSPSPTISPKTGNEWLLLLLPVITFIVMFLSMKLTRKWAYQPIAETEDQQKSNLIMDLFMPALSTFILFGVPAVVGVYWLYQNFLGIFQSWLLKVIWPLPTFTDEEMKRIEKEMNGKIKPDKSEKKQGSGKQVRSLHHIDDDDYDDPPKKTEKKAKSDPEDEFKEPEEEEKLPPVSPAVIAPAKLKDDSRNEKK
ncbi:MAG: YidC/Oxa1 family membrane protein insertase [Lachnospiraceae bacterium]|nr:YidC/Oxa1 family membrane protein insertase [Lachnospiraceae bacterium]